MELKVDEVQIPAKISFNYEELKAQLTKRCEEYRTSVYTEDSIKAAKADRAMLNKLKDSLNAERLRRQKEYMRPFEAFKEQVDDLIGIIGQASSAIDQQIKGYEEQEKARKAQEIKQIFDKIIEESGENAPDFVTLESIYDFRWMNKSKTLKSIEEEISSKLQTIGTNITLIGATYDQDSHDTQAAYSAAMAEYKRSFDLEKALTAGRSVLIEIQAMKKKKEAEEASRIEQVPQDHPEEAAIQVSEQVAAPIPAEAPEKKIRKQRVVVEFIAMESQFQALNDLFSGVKKAGAQFKIIEKEEL